MRRVCAGTLCASSQGRASIHMSPRYTRCSSRKSLMTSFDEKFISRDTDSQGLASRSLIV